METITTAELLRQRILQARRDVDLSQAEVEAELKLPAGAFSKIESGVRAITSTELAEFARLSGRHIGWFFASEPTTVSKLRGSAGSVEGRADLAWLHEFAEAFCYLEKSLGSSATCVTRKKEVM